jgi:hypothetical protein
MGVWSVTDKIIAMNRYFRIRQNISSITDNLIRLSGRGFFAPSSLFERSALFEGNLEIGQNVGTSFFVRK